MVSWNFVRRQAPPAPLPVPCKAPAAGLLTITSGAFTVTLVLAVEEAPKLSVTVAVSV